MRQIGSPLLVPLIALYTVSSNTVLSSIANVRMQVLMISMRRWPTSQNANGSTRRILLFLPKGDTRPISKICSMEFGLRKHLCY